MVKRKSQYKRKPRLKRGYDRHLRALREYHERFDAWQKVLNSNPSEFVINRVADLLARLGFAPNEHGVPRGDWPPVTGVSPLVLLDALGESVGVRPDGTTRQDTLTWKADVLEAATLVWAGAIDFDGKQIQEACPLALVSDVFVLLNYCDLETFWKRPGVGLTTADIREKWKRGERILERKGESGDAKTVLADMLRRARGGT